MRVHNIFLAALLAAGCAGPMDGSCRGAEECPGGACVNGRCRPLSGADLAGADDLGPAPADLARRADGGGDAMAASCPFDGDGQIRRAEAPFLVGLGALFAVNGAGSEATVDVVARNGAWDFTAPTVGERRVFDELLSPNGRWWSADFPTATFAEKLDDGQPLLGVFRAGADRLELLGVVSEQDGPQRTRATYATPIAVLTFPLALGSGWTAESDVSGLAQGVFFAAREKYVFSVDARGTTKVPAGAFDTLRLRVDYTQTYGLLVTTRITYLHLAECFGAVARVRSRDNEKDPAFTKASEYRRLATQ